MMTATAIASDKSAIRAVIDSMAKARYEKKAQVIAAPYARDAAIFNLAPPLVHNGIDIEETQQWLDTWNGPIQIEPRDFQISIADDIAFCFGYMRMTGNKKGVEQTVSFWMRETLCLQRREDGWCIVGTSTLPCRFIWMVVCARRSTSSLKFKEGVTMLLKKTFDCLG